MSAGNVTVIIDTDELYPFHFETDHGGFAVSMTEEQAKQFADALDAFDRTQQMVIDLIREQGGYNERLGRTGDWKAKRDTP